MSIRARKTVAALGGPLFVLLMLAVAYVFTTYGPAGYIGAVGSLMVATSLLLGIVLVVRPGGRMLRALGRGAVGLENSRTFAVLTVLLFLGAFLIPISMIMETIATGEAPVTYGTMALGGVLLFIPLSLGFGLVRGKYRFGGGLEITPDTISYRSFSTQYTAPWNRVVGATFETPFKLTVTIQGGSAVIISPIALGINGHTLQRFLHYYRINPNRRTELDSNAAIERFQSMS